MTDEYQRQQTIIEKCLAFLLWLAGVALGVLVFVAMFALMGALIGIMVKVAVWVMR